MTITEAKKLQRGPEYDIRQTSVVYRGHTSLSDCSAEREVEGSEWPRWICMQHGILVLNNLRTFTRLSLGI